MTFRDTVLLIIICILIFQQGNSQLAQAQSMLDRYKSEEIELIEEWRIGGDTMEEEYILAKPFNIAYDSKGNLFILDYQDKCIKKYNPEGKHIVTFGSEGKGPGEIMRASGIEVDPDDNIVIYDSGGRRFSKFTNNGETISSIRFREIVWNFDIAPDGDYMVEARRYDNVNELGINYIIMKVSPDLKVISYIDSARVKNNTWIQEEGNNTNIPIPFAPGISWIMLPSGQIVTGWSGDYSFKIYSTDLTNLKSYIHKAEKQKIIEKDKNVYFDRISVSYHEEGKSFQTTRGVSDWMRKKIKFPEYKPFFRGIRADGAGNILFLTYKEEDGYPLWDVFDKNGVFAIRTALPFMEGKTIFYKDKIAKTYLPEDDFPYVVQYRIK